MRVWPRQSRRMDNRHDRETKRRVDEEHEWTYGRRGPDTCMGGLGGTLPYVRPVGSRWTSTGVRMNGAWVLWMVDMAWMGGWDATCGGDDGTGKTQHGGRRLGTSVWKPVDRRQV